MAPEMKICTGCKYHVFTYEAADFVSYQVSTCTRECTVSIDPIYGTVERDTKLDKCCYSERDPGFFYKLFHKDICGPEGKYFEPK